MVYFDMLQKFTSEGFKPKTLNYNFRYLSNFNTKAPGRFGHLDCSVFFLTRENEKCPRKRFLVLFLVFFSGDFFFLPTFLKVYLGQFDISRAHFSNFFSV